MKKCGEFSKEIFHFGTIEDVVFVFLTGVEVIV